MSQSNLKSRKQIGRFAIVGIANTAIDFILLFLFKFLGLPAISANFISSTTAFLFSYMANKNYTFKATGGDTPRQIALFVAVTLFGLWVLQSAVIYLTEGAFVGILRDDGLGLLASKLLATLVSMTWNYAMYATVVFKQSSPTDQRH